MWNNTIGLEAQSGGNTAIEAAINAPQFGAGRAARRAAAAEAVQQTGGRCADGYLAQTGSRRLVGPGYAPLLASYSW